MSEIAVRFSQVRKVFTRKAAFTAIEDLTFAIRRGEYVSIVGRTGCGKSTTVNLLLGLERASSGSIEVLGHDPRSEFQALRGRIGCVFQGDRLLPWRTAIDNVRVPLEVTGLVDGADGKPSAQEWLRRVGLEGFESAYPHELSGGMRQRVALARALVSTPDLLIADEAFGHLDEVTARSLRGAFKDIATAQGATVIQITHSLDEAISQSDRILVFGRPGHVRADLRVADYASDDGRAELRRELSNLIENGPTTSSAPSLSFATAA